MTTYYGISYGRQDWGDDSAKYDRENGLSCYKVTSCLELTVNDSLTKAPHYSHADAKDLA